MNLVPSRETAQLARAAVRTAARTSGADAVLEHYHRVQPAQRAAFLATILDLAAVSAKSVTRDAASDRARRATERRQREDAAYDDDEARKAHAAYTGGTRTTWAVVGERVYKRRQQRALREARRTQDTAA